MPHATSNIEDDGRQTDDHGSGVKDIPYRYMHASMMVVAYLSVNQT